MDCPLAHGDAFFNSNSCVSIVSSSWFTPTGCWCGIFHAGSCHCTAAWEVSDQLQSGGKVKAVVQSWSPTNGSLMDQPYFSFCRSLAGGVGQDHVHHPCVWRNAKSFYCFLPWEKAGLCFQCILKSIHHEKTTNELLVSLYTLLRACTKQLCRWPCSLTENVSECWPFYPAQVFSVR